MAHLNLGLTHASLGSIEKAVTILRGIETIDDDGLKDPKTHLTTQVTALYHTGKFLLELGRAAEAVTLLRKAENRAKAVNYQAQGILNVLGEALQSLNKTMEEIKLMSHLSRDYLNTDSYVYLYMIYVSKRTDMSALCKEMKIS